MDFIFDILFGTFAGIFNLICPNYRLKKWQKILCIILSILLLTSSIGCFTAGIIILNEFQNSDTLGIVLTASGASLLTIQFVAFAVLTGYKLKAEARKKNDKKNNDSK